MIITEKKTKLISFVIYALSALILLVDYQTVLTGVREGLLSCAKYIVPSLFMISVVSGVLISYPYSENLFTNALARVFGFDKNAGICVFFGLLAGFPSGAAGAYELYEKGYITQRECEKAVYFTNNAGLAFIIGTVGALMGDVRYAVILWVSQTLASFTLANIFRTKNRAATKEKVYHNSQTSLVEAVKRGAWAMITVCAFVCFFTAVRLLIEDILGNYIHSELILGFLTSFLEIGNAVTCASELSKYSRILCSFSVAFGGFSAILQSVAVCPCVKLSKYVLSRIMMGFLCVGYVWLIGLIA